MMGSTILVSLLLLSVTLLVGFAFVFPRKFIPHTAVGLGLIASFLLGVSITVQPSFEHLASALGGVATLFGVLVAIRGLRTWEHQLKGTDQYEIGKKTAILSNNVYVQIVKLRRLAAMNFKEEESSSQETLLLQALAEFSRECAFTELFWGEKDIEPMFQLMSIGEKVVNAHRRLREIEGDPTFDPKTRLKWDRIAIYRGDEGDTTKKELDVALSGVKDVCRKRLGIS